MPAYNIRDEKSLTLWLERDASGCVDLKVSDGKTTSSLLVLTRDDGVYLNDGISPDYGIKVNRYGEVIVTGFDGWLNDTSDAGYCDDCDGEVNGCDCDDLDLMCEYCGEPYIDCDCDVTCPDCLMDFEDCDCDD